MRVDGLRRAPGPAGAARVDPRDGDRDARGHAFGNLSRDLLAIDGRTTAIALEQRLIVRSTADRILEAIDRPTLLVFEDLHWTDEMSLEVIGELARHAQTGRCS